MVEADILVPTDYMELAYVRDKPLSETHYVTDVQFTVTFVFNFLQKGNILLFQEKNEYGAEVRRDGRPMPVEYLLIDVPAGMPKEPCETFHISPAGFPIENRSVIGQVQVSALDMVALIIYFFRVFLALWNMSKHFLPTNLLILLRTSIFWFIF